MGIQHNNLLKGSIISLMRKRIGIAILLLFVSLVFAKAEYAGPAAFVSESPDILQRTGFSEIEKGSNQFQETSNLTEPIGLAQGRLEEYLAEKDPGPLSFSNFLSYAIRRAVALGVPATTLVLVLLFPLVGAIIAAARHLVGLRGYGLFTTAALSIAFLATGIGVGVLLFLVIMMVATASRVVLRKLRLQYLPRIALLLWFVSLVIFVILVISPYLGLGTLVSLSIFPILLLVLLTETFIGSQMGFGMRRAVELAAETIILAVLCYLVLSLEPLRKFAILNPEITVIAVALFDVFLGKYVGLRLLEYWRFRELIG